MTPDDTLLLEEIQHGLQQQPKTLPCKLFYDQHGSELFEQICAQPEYYVGLGERPSEPV